uniref:Uncharacterized protein n=1 Tax=viral metagenome TaxID=1070528 RepID=A0A6M3L1J6_9ZZZZ
MGWGSILFRFATTVVGAALGTLVAPGVGTAIGAGIGSGYGALHEGASLGEAAISAGTAAVGGYYGANYFGGFSPPYAGPGASSIGMEGALGAAGEFGSMTGAVAGAGSVGATPGAFDLATYAKYAVGALTLANVASSLTQAPEPPAASPYTYQPSEPAPASATTLPPTPPTGELTPIAPEMESRTEELPARLREPTTEDIDIMNARERERQAAFNEQRASEELKKIQLLGARDINLSPATRESEPTTALERLYGIQKTPGRAIHAYP